MKLQHLTESLFNRSKFSDFDDDILDATEALVNQLGTGGQKPVDYFAEPGGNEATVKLSNGVFDTIITIAKSGAGAYRRDLTIKINPKYHCSSESYFKDEISSSLGSGESKDDLLMYLDHAGEEVLDTLKSLEDWYMDVTGHYGRVKIYADWRGERKVTAIAGDFMLSSNSGKVY